MAISVSYTHLYQISRNLIVREKETEVQTEAAGSEAVTESETAGSEPVSYTHLPKPDMKQI